MKKIMMISLLALSICGCTDKEVPLCWVSIVVDESFNTLIYTTFEGKYAKQKCIEYFEKEKDDRKKEFEKTTFASDAHREKAILRLEESKYFPITAYKTVFWPYLFFGVLLFGAIVTCWVYFVENWNGSRPLTKNEKIKDYKKLENEFNNLKNKYNSEHLKTKVQEELKDEAYLNYVREVLKNQDEFALDKRYATFKLSDCFYDFDNFYCVAILNKELKIIAYNEFREGCEPKRISIQELYNKKQFFASE